MRRKQQKEITRTPQVLLSNGTIRVCDVEKYYGTDNNVTKAVDRVSFTVQKGEFTGIMGASGSGKTTLLNMISTIDHVTSGHIYYGNVDITELNEDALAEFRKENLGFVFQDYNLLDTLTIEENIVLAMTLHSQNRKEIRKKCDEILKLLQIDEIRDKFPYQVSGGQKQRCACARALIHHPQLSLRMNRPAHSTPGAAQTLHEILSENEQRAGFYDPDGNARCFLRAIADGFCF